MWLTYIVLSGIVCLCLAFELSVENLRRKELRTMLIEKSKSASLQILLYQWESFKSTHNKHYAADEDIERMKIFAENSLLIAEHNELYRKGVVTYELGMNKFGDRSHEERMKLLGFRPELSTKQSAKRNDHNEISKLTSTVNPSLEKDWRKEGAVGPVKNQGDCASSWAFSATGALEGQYFRVNKRLLDLSEQNLIDCSYGFGNDGCTSGLPEMAFKYVEENGGIDTEQNYPYKGYEPKYCRYASKSAGATTTGYTMIPQDEVILQKAVFKSGPISVCIDGAGFGFHFYKRGVYYNATCNWQYEYLNHAVLIVGYSNRTGTGDYWLVKNSWGEDWGMGGFIAMARNRDNNCGIATNAFLPFIKGDPAFGVHQVNNMHKEETYTKLCWILCSIAIIVFILSLIWSQRRVISTAKSKTLKTNDDKLLLLEDS